MTGGPGSLCLQHRGCSTPSGLMLEAVPLSRGFHPGLIYFTPSGWPPSRGFHPGLIYFTPSGWPPSRGFSPRAYLFHPFGVASLPRFSPRAYLFHPFGVASLPGFSPRAFLFQPFGMAFRSLPRRFGPDHADKPLPPLATLKGPERRAQGANPGKDGVSLEVQP